ncbi:saposin domain-containing protein, partial [Salmonella sp. s54395]|uniref:saposin domain-containing protein n=1 Tax=Salmonella sp. s54395 TaxID=3159664 RepID=UPI0039803D05
RPTVNIKDARSNFKQIKKLAKKNKNWMRMGQRGMDRMGRRGRRAILVSIGGREDVNEIPYDVSDSFTGYEEVPAQKKCEVCRYFSSAAEGVLEYNEEDITNGLTIVFEDICNSLPEQWKPDCNTEIKDVLPGVIYQG